MASASLAPYCAVGKAPRGAFPSNIRDIFDFSDAGNGCSVCVEFADFKILYFNMVGSQTFRRSLAALCIMFTCVGQISFPNCSNLIFST